MNDHGDERGSFNLTKGELCKTMLIVYANLYTGKRHTLLSWKLQEFMNVSML